MALHLNFYHEIHREAQARARDPVKLAGLGALAVAVLFLAYYGYRNYSVGRIERNMRSTQAEWAKLEPAKVAAKKREEELFAEQKSNKALMDRIQGRFYWAPLLSNLATVTPPTVQITSLTGDYADPEKPVNVVISGLSAGHQPRSAAEMFRLALEKEVAGQYPGAKAVFDANSLEETEAQVEWNGETLSTARFRIRLTFEAKPEKKEEASSAAKTKETK